MTYFCCCSFRIMKSRVYILAYISFFCVVPFTFLFRAKMNMRELDIEKISNVPSEEKIQRKANNNN